MREGLESLGGRYDGVKDYGREPVVKINSGERGHSKPGA